MASMTARALNTSTMNASCPTQRSSTYSPLSQPSCSPRCLPALPHLNLRQNARSPVQTMAYRGQNCQDNYRRGGFAWGPFMMGPDAAMAGAALADMARKFQASGGFGQNIENTYQLPLAVDLVETTEHYLLTADVPGLQKSDLKISVNQKERNLKISGERKRPESSDKTNDDEQQQKFRRQFERRMGKFQRVFSQIPDTADLSAVSARVDKGVLTVSIKKTVTAETDDTMDINIE